ncbi:PP0621 family protein [Candidimonas nitroreducens]|uniref:PP0621 family protein n=1 Tax=Candidimonas nitroreducens TaxID=683354 RepID=UPI001303B1A6|nr:PP0621 family protein [Candidimonas nitroreducens]
MGKVLIWVLLILGGMLLARIMSQNNARQQSRPRQAPPRPMPPVQAPETMVRCAHCGIHLPRSEAVLVQGKTWCSTEHAKLGVRK